MGEVRQMRPLNILVVDDNLDQVRTLSMLLRMEGHDVDFAINGIVAIEVAKRLRPDIIMADHKLPDTRGYILARNIRSVAGLEHAFVIGITGEALTREQALQLGYDELLRKPIDMERMYALVKACSALQRSSKGAR